MAHKGTLFVPTEKDRASDVLEAIRNSITKDFGGCTVIKNASGDWHSDAMDTVVSEDVSIILVTASDRSELLSKFEACGQMMKEQLDEEAVHFTIQEVDSFFV